jgi:DNA repair exonuclease SbcCD ATPase subunit
MNRDQKQCGCNSNSNSKKNLNINIKWQRLVAKGETCPRCESTEQELNKAINKLQQVLSPLEIKVTLEKEELNISEFKQDPLQSNRILINEQPIENLLKGKVGQSPCCEVCGLPMPDYGNRWTNL